MTIHLDPAYVSRALATCPDLCIDGLRYPCPTPDSPYGAARFPERRAMLLEPKYLRHIETAYAYLHHFELDKRIGSYGLKHVMERWGGDNGLESYVTNGCAILAALLAGYQIVRTPFPSPNCRFRRPT
jgi:hypothetical protein